MLKLYGYMKCGTCRKAIKWLDNHGVAYTFIDITEEPPTPALLRGILAEGRYGLRQLFNTSGVLYREMGIKTKLAEGMSKKEAIALLGNHGKLVKRPIVTDGKTTTVGFSEPVFAEAWG